MRLIHSIGIPERRGGARSREEVSVFKSLLSPLFSGLSITLCLNEELLKLQKLLTLQPWHLNFGVV